MIDFSQNIILENEVVLLKPLQKTDFESLLYYSENEPELWKYSIISAAGKENLEKYLEFAFSEKKKKISYPFVVICKKDNKIIGTTRFYDIQESQKTLQLGYTWYGKNYQGAPINKNCKYLLLQFAFENWNMERVEFRADANNSKSIQAMKNIGCVVEGILRNNVFKNENERRNTIILSILREEWFKTVKENLYNKIK